MADLTNNYFELFNLPANFEIDTVELAERYRQLQRAVHPDKFAGAPDRDRRLALQHTSQINEAFQTLKNPLTRGRYLLQLQGMDWNDEKDTQMDADFLMTQMALREELAELTQVSALNAFLARLDEKITHLNRHLAEQFEEENYQNAKESLRKLQFFYKLREETLQIEERLEN